MNRAQFLRLIGVGSLITATGLPSFAEVEKHIAEVDKITESEDPFWHIRKLMKERALPDWEYHFRKILDGNCIHYTVILYQNDNIHRESHSEFNDTSVTTFNEKAQEMMFRRLIHGVDMWNKMSPENREIFLFKVKGL